MGLDAWSEVSLSASRPAGRSRERIVFGAVLLLALLIRLFLLSSRWINPDEGAHLMDGRLVLDGLVPSIDFSSRQFIYVHLLALYLRFSGSDLLFARVFPVVVTVGAGAFLYWTARRLYDGAVALLGLVFFLLLPFSVLMTINVKTEPFVLLFSLGGLFFAVRGVQARVPVQWPFFLSGILLGLAYYVRQSALAVALAVGVLMLAIRPIGLGANLKRLSVFAAGVLAVTALVVLYYLRHVSLAPALDLSQNPIHFVLDNLRGAGKLLGRAGVQRTQELLVGPSREQPLRITLQNIREPAYFHLFLLMGAFLSLPQFWAAFRQRKRNLLLAFWSLVPWLLLMSLAYAFWSVRRGFFPAYFLEFLPPLCILTAATVVAALQKLRAQPNPVRDALIVGTFLVALVVVHRVELARPIFFVGTTIVLAAVYLGDDRPLGWSLLVVLVALATVAVVRVAARLSGAQDVVLYVALAGAVYLGIFLASSQARRGGSGPRFAGFVAYSLVVSTFIVSVSASMSRLDLTYDCSWSPNTLRQIAATLKQEARAGDEVMSGGVIWEFQSGLRPFGVESHPLVFVERMSVSQAEAILDRIKTKPPAFVVLDGFTELTYLRNLPQIQGLLDSRYALRSVAADGVRLFALRRGPA